MALVETLLAALALLGHGIFWVGLANKFHATGFSRRIVNLLSDMSHVCLASIPAAVVWWLLRDRHWESASFTRPSSLGPLFYYIVLCWLLALVHAPIWIRQRLQRSGAHVLRREQSKTVDIAAQLGRRPVSGLCALLLAHVPGNQFLKLEVNEKVLAVPHLPPALEGLSLVHLSDLHFSGRVDREYFRAVVDLANQFQADLLAITGDICDAARYVEWIPDTLGLLESRFGRYFILGNHDLRLRDVRWLRGTLAGAGLVDLGGRSRSVAIHGGEVLLAGNELPWFSPAADIGSTRRVGEKPGPLRILLAHSPDQFAWARARNFHMVLAGHTHGGQIRLPMAGAVVCPSWAGVKYASGIFYEPPSIMHVSRGISSLLPLRVNCPPELTKLVLTRAAESRD